MRSISKCVERENNIASYQLKANTIVEKGTRTELCITKLILKWYLNNLSIATWDAYPLILGMSIEWNLFIQKFEKRLQLDLFMQHPQFYYRLRLWENIFNARFNLIFFEKISLIAVTILFSRINWNGEKNKFKGIDFTFRP